MTELRLCPFCGTEPDIKEINNSPHHTYYAVRCDCDVMMHDFIQCGQGWWTKAEAVKAWNTRKEK